MAEIEEASLVKLGTLVELGRASSSMQRAFGPSAAQVASPQRLGLFLIGAWNC